MFLVNNTSNDHPIGFFRESRPLASLCLGLGVGRKSLSRAKVEERPRGPIGRTRTVYE